MLSPIELRHQRATSRTRTGIAGATVPHADRCTIVTTETPDRFELSSIEVAARCLAKLGHGALVRSGTSLSPARVTEEARFELAMDLDAHCGLAVRRLQPLGHSSSVERRGLEPLESLAGHLVYSQVQLPLCQRSSRPPLKRSSQGSLKGRTWDLPGWIRTSDLRLPGATP